MRHRTARRGSTGSALCASAVVALGVLVAMACSNSGSSAGGNDAGGVDGACGPLPESLSVTGLSDCVANVPNPCCAGFYEFSCAGGDGGGTQCSETNTCVRAARYDQTLCAGAQAYSCPDLSGTNYATITTPSCEQMEGVGPNGEGIRWCCGANLPPVTTIDAAAPQPSEDASTPGADASATDATTE